ncbi:MAG TPA: histidine kinase [Holophaga sp.]|nr:histidine kinase [Holophaga sp.]HPS67385.1 histidine kinase [Holophaga sp.]
MRQEVIRSSLLHRVRQRTNLVLVSLVGGIFCIFRLTADMRGPFLAELVLPFVLLYAHLALSPIPWQWTGDDEPRAGLGRGFLQALVFNAAWIGLAMAGLFLFAGPPKGGFMDQPPPPPPGSMPPPMGPRIFRPEWTLGMLNLAFGIIFGWVFAEKEATEARERLTADLLRQSRSKALQNQLEPHVLYNALNSLSELVYEDPLAAEEVIARLADLYRMLTIHGKADRIPLGQERKLVEAYLAMEQMRLGERLAVVWDWPASADEILAPPLFLQPLVENAIKHGISPSDQGGTLVISCVKIGPAVKLSVRNSGCAPREGAPRGVGLGNLESRLQLWTEAAGRFSLGSQDGWTTARIEWTQGATA